MLWIHRRGLLKVLALSFLLLTSGIGCSVEPKSAKRDPRRAPDFALTSTDGKQIRLSDHLGKVVLIHFWATWCSPCRAAIPHEMELQERYGPEGFAVLGLSMDKNPADLSEFLRRRPVNYSILQVDEATREAYGGVPTVPLTLVIDRQGRIRKKKLGFTLEMAESVERTIQRLLDEGSSPPVRGYSPPRVPGSGST